MGYGKSFDDRYKELRKAGKSIRDALSTIIEERKMQLSEVPSKHRAKPKEKKSAGTKTSKRSRRG